MDSKNDALIEVISGQAGAPVGASIIWLHGLGASGDDFVPVVPELGLPPTPAVRFIFPHAPVRPITINGGMSMRGWFDITSLDFEAREQDLDGMRSSVEIVNKLIEAEIERGVAAEKIIIAGFSQGGAIALMTALEGKYPLAGVMALSTYLPDAEQVLANYQTTRQQAGTDQTPLLPVFMAHGQFDDVIQIRFAEASKSALEKAGITPEWHSYPMPHSVSPEEITDIGNWLKQRLFG